MFFNLILYISLAICLLGLAWKLYSWLSRKISVSSRDMTVKERFFAALRGFVKTVFSLKIKDILAVFLLDVIIQRKIIKQDFLRWFMHMCIFAGFMLLLLMHALDEIITMKLFADYSSTVNPYFFLRELGGIIVLIGLGIAFYRRFVLKVPRLSTKTPDVYALGILSLIMVSGFFLEGAKMLSHGEYQRMTEEYADTDDESELNALESYWVQEFGLASPNVSPPFSEDVISEGRDIHEMSCSYCHSKHQWAFAGYGLNRVMSPAAASLEGVGAVSIFWHIHILACFFGLAYLPFSKMFHVISTPVGLIVSSVTESESADPANVATRQAIELDACTNCCTCSLTCSQMNSYQVFDNPYILPSERMACLRRMGLEGNPKPEELRALRQGAYICSNCDRCTVVCPAGINLRELWITVREDLIRKENYEPALLSQFSFVRGLNKSVLGRNGQYSAPVTKTKTSLSGKGETGEVLESPVALMDTEDLHENKRFEREAFSNCFGCRNCTTVCPVVGHYENPEEELGLLPHQIMCCLGLGLTEAARSAGMLWECSTCYQCQEHCPQGVAVTDLLYDLKNLAIQKKSE